MSDDVIANQVRLYQKEFPDYGWHEIMALMEVWVLWQIGMMAGAPRVVINNPALLSCLDSEDMLKAIEELS